MQKYIELLLSAANNLGDIKTGEVEQASKYLPKRVEFCGFTKDGEKFEIQLRIGETLDAAE